MTELICAMEVYILLTALRDCSTSLARMRATSLSPCLAASLSDFSTLASSRLIPGEGGRGGEIQRDDSRGEEGGGEKRMMNLDIGRAEREACGGLLHALKQTEVTTT